ncbi:MAG: hypothetical protein KJ666_08700 [Bacteroidetes bacterium]|nr:hypothetical protein [Bacteroidota bacterium]
MVLSIHSDESELLLPAELGLMRQAGENLSLLRFSSVFLTESEKCIEKILLLRQSLSDGQRTSTFAPATK